MIIPLYKKYGDSTHLLAQKAGQRLNEKATHTGTLDPAAEGVVVVLTGDDRYKKQELADSVKVYRADILFGIATDTHDLIGIPTVKNVKHVQLDENTLRLALQNQVGSFTQLQPDFSAKRVGGKSSFDIAKEGGHLEKVTNSVTIHSIRLLSLIKVTIPSVREYHSTRLELIQGDFRQAVIHDEWQQLLRNQTREDIDLPLVTIEVSCSKRTYIRSLVRDISASLGDPAVLYSLIRTTNGPYSITNCVCLV